MTHQRYEEDAGAYVLGALPELERQAFERHLERCDDCRREVERLRPAAEALPRGATPLVPPPQLKASLMQVVEAEARESAQAPRTRRSRRTLLAELMPALRRRPAVAWVPATLLLAVGAAGGVGLSRALDSGGPRTVAARVDETQLPRAKARLVVPEDGRAAVLRTSGMPPLDKGSIYQVWLERDGEVTSQSLFEVGRDGTGAGAVPDGLEDADAVMVTREPANGSRAPTEKPILAVKL